MDENLIFDAKSPDDLLELLKVTNINVPRRSEGRDKSHREHYCICHLLFAIAHNNILEFPLQVFKTERPDYKISFTDVNKNIGIEHTDSESARLGQKRMASEKLGNNFLWITKDKPNARTDKLVDVENEIKDNVMGAGWVNNEPEDKWVDYIFHFIKKKYEKLQKNGFRSYDENWLLLYDNSELRLLDIDIDYAIPKLIHLIDELDGKKFSDIFLLVKTGLICHIKQKSFYRYSYNNIWENR